MSNRRTERRRRWRLRLEALARGTSQIKKPSEIPKIQSPQSVQSKLGLLKWLVKPVSLGWAFFLGLIALGEFAYDFYPRINIETAELADESEPLSAFFRIRNIGHVHVRDVAMTCKIFEGNTLRLTISGSTLSNGQDALLGQPLIPDLPPEESATRDCLTGQSRGVKLKVENPNAIRIDIIAEYHWSVIGKAVSTSRHFSTRRAANGKFFLVPDIEH
jgi:hypothetical protein